jgi:hypothetical protein
MVGEKVDGGSGERGEKASLGARGGDQEPGRGIGRDNMARRICLRQENADDQHQRTSMNVISTHQLRFVS